MIRTFRYWLQLSKKEREEEDEEIKEHNRQIEVLRAVIAADLENERQGRVKPDRLSEEERRVVMGWAAERVKKDTEIQYWIRIVDLRAGGLTEEQAREKIYHDLLEKVDPNSAKIFREFQDKIHPFKPGDRTPPPAQ